jgi:hypothetical protein
LPDGIMATYLLETRDDTKFGSSNKN